MYYLPSSVSIGKASNGVWLTSSLKEYPPALCKCIAETLHQHIMARPIDHSVAEPPPSFLAVCDSMNQKDFGAFFGADYAQ